MLSSLTVVLSGVFCFRAVTPKTMVVGTLSIDGADIPDVYALHLNYPNPFNSYDILGRSIRSLLNTTQSAGYRFIQWDATNNLGEPVSAGMYI